MTDESATSASAAYFAALGDALGGHGSGGPQPRDVVAVAMSAVDGADFGGLTLLVHGKHPHSVGTTDAVVDAVDELQYALREGPCWDAGTGEALVVADDLAVSPEWPQFGPRCVAETGIVGMLSVRLRLSGDDAAAMNLYARRPRAFSGVDGTVAAMFAALALHGEVNADRAGHSSKSCRAAARSVPRSGSSWPRVPHCRAGTPAPVRGQPGPRPEGA